MPFRFHGPQLQPVGPEAHMHRGVHSMDLIIISSCNCLPTARLLSSMKFSFLDTLWCSLTQQSSSSRRLCANVFSVCLEKHWQVHSNSKFFDSPEVHYIWQVVPTKQERAIVMMRCVPTSLGSWRYAFRLISYSTLQCSTCWWYGSINKYMYFINIVTTNNSSRCHKHNCTSPLQ